MVLALVMEPLRHVTAFLMRRARESDPVSRNGLLDVLHDPVSPVRHSLQYIACLLLRTPPAPRLQLLFYTRGCATLEEWGTKFPESMGTLRRCLLLAAASLHTRLVIRLKQFPWRLMQLADTRVAQSTREQIAQEYDNTEPCCLPPFARRLREQGVTGAMLLTDAWLDILWQVSRVTHMQICDVEWRHRRCKSRLHRHGQSRLGHFTGKDILGEGQVLLEGVQSCLRQARMQAAGGSGSGRPTQQQQQRSAAGSSAAQRQRQRASSALQLFHWDRTRAQASNPAEHKVGLDW